MEINGNYSDELAEQAAFIFVEILDTPEQVSKNKKSYTGEFLKKFFKRLNLSKFLSYLPH